MSTETIRDRVRTRWPPVDRWTVRVWLAVVLLEAWLLYGYFALTGGAPTRELRYVVYPFVWIDVGLWAVAHADPSPGSRPHRLLGVAVGVAYFLAVMAIPGLVGLGTADHAVPHVRVAWYTPGWGPLVAANSSWIRLYLVPFEVVGYASLAYLVYANALRLVRGTLSGALGLVTCVGCTVPVLAPLVGLLGGPASALSTTAYAYSYDVGTVVFVLAVLLLYRSQREGAA